MERASINSRALAALWLSTVLVIACSDPKCPRNMVQTGKMCRACEPGFGARDNVCRLLDAGASGPVEGRADLDAAGMQPGDAGPASSPEAALGCSRQPELCGNGLDDDCDQHVDETSDLAESCSGVDDDCDGKVDEGVLAGSKASDLFPEEISAPSVSQVRVVPNGVGGAWLLYRAGVLSNLQDEGRRPINMVGIGADGRPVGHVAVAEQATSDTTRFVAGGDGKWVATFAREIPESTSSRSQYLFIRLFTATALAFAGESRIDYREDRNYGTFLAPLAISLFEDAQGVVHLLVAYEADTQAAGVWGTSVRLAYVRRAPSGLWSQQTSYSLFSSPLGAGSVAIARIPCRDEWAVATVPSTAEGDGRLAIYTPTGSGNRQIDVLPNTGQIDGIAVASDGCGSEAELVVAHSEFQQHTKLSRWFIEPHNGDARADEAPLLLGMPMHGAALQRWGGSWFVAGTGSDSTFTVLRASFQKEASVEFIRVLDATGPNPGALPDGAYSQVADIMRLEHEIYVVAANSFMQSNLTAQLPSRGQGFAEAAAVTFHLGCH